jgi:transglutaminase superfamily protein
MLNISPEMFLSRSSFRLSISLSVLAVCLGLNAVPALAQPLFLTVASTPYDRQMSPISPVLNSVTGPPATHTSLATINQWITSLRAIPYQYSLQWKTPSQVASDAAADCKGKAILLYAILRSNGATHVRFVIGKHRATDLRTHAWLEWDTTSGTYLLDPTFNKTIERIERQDPSTYIPHYAYNGSQKYRAIEHRRSGTSVVASN